VCVLKAYAAYMSRSPTGNWHYWNTDRVCNGYKLLCWTKYY